MEGYRPDLRPVFERLREEPWSIAAVRAALAALPAGVAVAEPDRFRAELERMNEQLTTHRAYEEAEILPLLVDVPWPPAP